MNRLFVALRPPPPIRAALLALYDGVAGARWQSDEQLHLTLRYIGPVERPVAEDVALALAQVVAPVPQVRLAGVGRFDRRGTSEALWAGVEPHTALAHLHRKVDQACVRAGLPPERRAYLPHLTVARLSRSAGRSPAIERWLAEHAGLSSAPFELPHLMLYESHLASDGARYEPVARWPLG
ncbi:MAG: RNA 2',3'-cyclic phosphodiesterase [Janthinobacterium lividum]